MTKAKNKIFNKTLVELEKERPGEILPKNRLPLIGRENDFVKIPLKKLKTEEIRFLISQQLGQKVLLPLAIEKLRKNPLASGNNFDGDLLGAVLSVKKEFWLENPLLYREVEEILQRVEKNETAEAIEILTLFLPQKAYDFRKNIP